MKWISCKNELPKEMGLYLVSATNGKVYIDFYAGISQLNAKPLWDRVGKDVVAWMTLPKPFDQQTPVCPLDTDGDGNFPRHPKGCPKQGD